MDTESNSSRNDQFANGVGSWPFNVPNLLRRSYCDYDLKHVFVFNAVYDVPTPHWGRAPDAVLGGWEVASIITRSSGPPFSVVMGGDPLGRNDSNPLDFPDRVSAPGCDNPVNQGNITQYINVQCFAAPNPLTLLGNARRNILRGAGLAAVDFSLYKNIPISEALRIQFRTEVFNIANHTNFNPPLTNNQVFDQAGARISSAGLITSTQTSSRQIQFGLKLYF
jgi:hypothetical protein